MVELYNIAMMIMISVIVFYFLISWLTYLGVFYNDDTEFNIYEIIPIFLSFIISPLLTLFIFIIAISLLFFGTIYLIIIFIITIFHCIKVIVRNIIEIIKSKNKNEK